jgi:LacI family transcriptional regulator
MGRPTIKDVARRAKVSLGSVSRVLNNYPDVNPAIRKKVGKAIADLGYSPDSLARGMRSGATRMVGVLIRNIIIPSLASFVRAIQDELFDAGYVPLIACSDNQKEREMALLDLFASRRMEGVIMLSASDRDATLVAAREALALPIVLFDRAVPENRDSVLVDHRRGLHEATAHLLALGHTRIALVTGPRGIYPTVERLAGFRAAHAEAGLKIDPDLIVTRSFEDDVTRTAVAELLARKSRPTAIIMGGTTTLPGAMQMIKQQGLRIPEDISLIGAIDSDLSALADPPVTVIHWDYEAIGRAAAQILLQRIANPHQAPQRHTFPTRIIFRESCAPPPRLG